MLCLLPPVRRGLAGLLRRYATRRVQAQVVRVRARRGPATGPPAAGTVPPAGGIGPPASGTGPPAGGIGPPAAGSGRVIEGEIEP